MSDKYKTGKLYVAIRDVDAWKFKSDKQCLGHFSSDRKMWVPHPQLRHIETGKTIIFVKQFKKPGIPASSHGTVYKFLYGAEIVYITMIEVEKLRELTDDY